MDEKLKIRISIADRVYPLTVTSETQEESLREAAKKIDAMIKQYEENYAVRDKQDVLAMCALQFATQSIHTQLSDSQEVESNTERLERLNENLNRFFDTK